MALQQMSKHEPGRKGSAREPGVAPPATRPASTTPSATASSDKKRTGEAKPPAFDPIEAALRRMFNDVAKEEVPDDFSQLVAQFAQKQRGADKK
jgi:hypothetical protein